MEVHHHPHVEKKSFKEYLLEGLMIFIAVSMGFFAENIRENISNREIVKKNMESIVSGLKTDTTNLKDLIAFNKLRIKNLESINKFRYQNLADTNILKTFVPILISAFKFDYFRSSSVAIDQMKSTGGFRLVKQHNVVDSIFAYYDYNGALTLNREILGSTQTKIYDIFEKLFDAQNLTETSKIIYKNKDLLFEFFNAWNILNVGLKNFYTPHLETQLQKASELIELLEKQYDLK